MTEPSARQRPARTMPVLLILAVLSLLASTLPLASAAAVDRTHPQFSPSSSVSSAAHGNRQRDVEHIFTATAQRGSARSVDGIEVGTQLHGPLVAADGVVTGVADDAAQAEFTAALAGGRRGLLHGNRRARAYTLCPRCTPITCSTTDSNRLCSGHCKSTRQLFLCRVRSGSGGICLTPEEEKPDPETLPADPLDPLFSAVVTAPMPYIGCANITGVSNGCPPPGTTGTLNGVRVEVLASWCEQHLYPLQCASEDQEVRTPFFPFGYCSCFMKSDGHGSWIRPCRLSNLDWTGPGDGGEGGADAPVRVEADHGVVRTTFGIREDVDTLRYTVDHTFTVKGSPVDVKLEHYLTVARDALDENIELEGPLPAE